MDATGDTPDRWWEYVPWWTDIRLAFAAGQVFGYQQRCAEQDAEDDAVHRAAAKVATRLADRPRRSGDTLTRKDTAA